MEKISRRQFLKRGALLGIGFFALPLFPRRKSASAARPVKARFARRLAG